MQEFPKFPTKSDAQFIAAKLCHVQKVVADTDGDDISELDLCCTIKQEVFEQQKDSIDCGHAQSHISDVMFEFENLFEDATFDEKVYIIRAILVSGLYNHSSTATRAVRIFCAGLAAEEFSVREEAAYAMSYMLADSNLHADVRIDLLRMKHVISLLAQDIIDEELKEFGVVELGGAGDYAFSILKIIQRQEI